MPLDLALLDISHMHANRRFPENLPNIPFDVIENIWHDSRSNLHRPSATEYDDPERSKDPSLTESPNRVKNVYIARRGPSRVGQGEDSGEGADDSLYPGPGAGAFDARANRKTLASATGIPGTDCPASGSSTANYTYDSADRQVDSSYAYDAFSRTSTKPGGVTLEYYNNDMIRRQETVGTKRQTWQLDGIQHIRCWTSETKSGGDTLSGLTLVGARAYDSTTSRFLQLDPVVGGGANAYGYPPDPITMFNLDGKGWFSWGRAYRVTVCGRHFAGPRHRLLRRCQDPQNLAGDQALGLHSGHRDPCNECTHPIPARPTPGNDDDHRKLSDLGYRRRLRQVHQGQAVDAGRRRHRLRRRPCRICHQSLLRPGTPSGRRRPIEGSL
ncbi:RHS repeat-associated core domain-containing protein [Streptomyces sp. NPDC059743]|uniref:RHS repeat-associated core domain-containing protein n=1 Tax=Streptomyces sp. NPDC059743 TaxID=3346928 RepID=UPI00364C01D7